jgi:hypothetical protein
MSNLKSFTIIKRSIITVTERIRKNKIRIVRKVAIATSDNHLSIVIELDSCIYEINSTVS